MSEVVPSEGTYAYGGYPDVDTLYRQQASETDRKKREALLLQIQQLLHERVRFAPVFEYHWPSGIGPRVAEPALMLTNPYSVVGPARGGAPQAAVVSRRASQCTPSGRPESGTRP